MRKGFSLRLAAACLVGVLLAVLAYGVSGGIVSKSSQPHGVPTVTVSPNKNLADLQKVTMAGTHFSSNASIGTVECQSGALSESDCDLNTLVYTNADANGVFHLSRYVRRMINVGFNTVDCAAPSSCILGAGNIADLSEAAGATISFDPKKPPVVAKVTVKPNTKLRDHQLVSVSGKGFTPGDFVQIVECAPSLGDFGCDYGNYRYVNVGDNMSFTANNFPVERILHLDGDVDCASSAGACVIEAVGSFGGGSQPAEAPLSFDPKVPPVVPSLIVSPATGLGDLQVVTVNGNGFLPGSSVQLNECTGGSFACAIDAHTVTAGFNGEFALTFSVHRVIVDAGIQGPSSGSTDCAKQLGLCNITAFAPGVGITSPTAALGFDPSKPPVKPAIAVTPNTSLQDNQRVSVNLGGFAPFGAVAVLECSADAVKSGNLGYCDSSTLQLATSPAAGGAPSTSFFVHRAINGQDGLVDCGAKNGACVLAAVPYSASYYGGGYGGGLGGTGGSPLSASSRTKSKALVPANAPGAPTGIRALKASAGSTLPGVAFAPLSFAKTH